MRWGYQLTSSAALYGTVLNMFLVWCRISGYAIAKNGRRPHTTAVLKICFLCGTGVDLILGLNGLIWVCPHVARGPDGAPVQPPTAAGAAVAAASITRAQREACVRVAGAIKALAALYLPIYPDAILDTYQVGGTLAGLALLLPCNWYAWISDKVVE